MSEGSTPRPRARAAPASDRKLTGERLEKKRETDRESQRAVRNRTKAYIAHLEKLVQTLQESQEDERLANMTEQCKQLREENQTLKTVLTSISKMTKSIEGTLDDSKARNTSFSPNAGSMLDQKSPDQMMDARSPVGEDTRRRFSTTNSQPRREALWRQNSLAYSDESAEHTLTPPEEGPNTTNYARAGSDRSPQISIPALIPQLIPNATTLQQQPSAVPSETTTEPKKPSHVFDLVNQVISNAENFKVAALNPEVEVDVAIRAVALGWPAVLERYALDPVWQVIQQIEQEVFFCCGPVERLAILRLLRLKLLQHVAETNKEEFGSQIPPFMTPRPIQRLIEHSPLIEYFAWPELRELLILKEKAAGPPSSTDTNVGAAIFASSIRISWPFEVSNAWLIHPTTGIFSYSRLFLERFQDIQNWTMCPEFFTICPETIGLIRVYDSARDSPPKSSTAPPKST